jgi:hypothetical protein
MLVDEFYNPLAGDMEWGSQAKVGIFSSINEAHLYYSSVLTLFAAFLEWSGAQ